MQQACTTFRDCHQDLVRYLQRRLNCPNDAEDIAHEAFLRLVTSAQIKSDSHAKAFVFHVARNLAIDELRKRSIRSRVEVLETAAELTDATEQSLETLWQVRGRLAVVLHAVSKLPSRCRRVFVLHKIWGLSHKEVASRLDISVNAVEAHIVRGLAYCRSVDERYQAADSVPTSSHCQTTSAATSR